MRMEERRGRQPCSGGGGCWLEGQLANLQGPQQPLEARILLGPAQPEAPGRGWAMCLSRGWHRAKHTVGLQHSQVPECLRQPLGEVFPCVSQELCKVGCFYPHFTGEGGGGRGWALRLPE